ncbi:hypothetical protein KI610_13040 [Ferribacterium limneticum]|nr:hypothetical protein KI610_13040 [Ferribacterium limneticum]
MLNAVEAQANRAIVQELRIIKKEVLQLHPSLNPDDQEHAVALLLKLDHLLPDQLVIADETAPDQGRRPVAQVA